MTELKGRIEERTLAALFNEELGCVLQVRKGERDAVMQALRDAGLSKESQVIGHFNDEGEVRLILSGRPVFAEKRSSLHRAWPTSRTRSRGCATIRPAPTRVRAPARRRRPGAVGDAHLRHGRRHCRALHRSGARPRVAVLREQGVNGQVEMAASFNRAGFEAVDVHMSDILGGRVSLADFKAFAACGGFSYGDVLGAGEGWAKSILFNSRARDEFEAFFPRGDTSRSAPATAAR